MSNFIGASCVDGFKYTGFLFKFHLVAKGTYACNFVWAQSCDMLDSGPHVMYKYTPTPLESRPYNSQLLILTYQCVFTRGIPHCDCNSKWLSNTKIDMKYQSQTQRILTFCWQIVTHFNENFTQARIVWHGNQSIFEIICAVCKFLHLVCIEDPERIDDYIVLCMSGPSCVTLVDWKVKQCNSCEISFNYPQWVQNSGGFWKKEVKVGNFSDDHCCETFYFQPQGTSPSWFSGNQLWKWHFGGMKLD